MQQLCEQLKGIHFFIVLLYCTETKATYRLLDNFSLYFSYGCFDTPPSPSPELAPVMRTTLPCSFSFSLCEREMYSRYRNPSGQPRMLPNWTQSMSPVPVNTVVHKNTAWFGKGVGGVQSSNNSFGSATVLRVGLAWPC